MILVALGANLESPRFGPPRATLEAALEAMAARGLTILRRSSWYRSAPVPASDQPWFVNGVVAVRAPGSAGETLDLLHAIEADFGRERGVRDAARVLDLDLLAFDDQISPPGAWPVLPHPRLAERAFVLHPLAECAPQWRHPVTGLAAAVLKARIPPGKETVERLA